jgi:glycerophosphoryl diester phosphodiesterase
VRIAHALGGIGGQSYTNSREAFERSFEKGFRWFETDVAFTADGVPVCLHEGLEGWLGLPRAVERMSSQEFLAGRLAGTYTPLGLVDLLELLRARRETALVLDTAGLSAESLGRIGQAIDTVDPRLRRRVGVELYWPRELALLREEERRRGPFAFLVFANYKAGLDTDELVRFVSESGIPLVAVGSALFSRDLASRLHASGARILVGTVNDRAEAIRLAMNGADGFITDFLAPGGTL